MRVIYVTHFVGFAQPLQAQLQSFRKERNLKLIEDCALALALRDPTGVAARQRAATREFFASTRCCRCPTAGLLSARPAHAGPEIGAARLHTASR